MKGDFSKSSSELWMSKNVAAIEGNVSNYYKWNLDVFALEKNRRILDLGCGPGVYLDEIMFYAPSCYVGVDYSENNIIEIKKKFADYAYCSAFCLSLTNIEWMKVLGKYTFDYVLCLDVLEHIEDDGAVLRNIYKIMKATGANTLFLRVPALQSIYGKNDEAIGHYRRYSLRGLAGLLGKCSFSVKKIRYQNMLGILPWYIKGSLLKKQQAITSSEGRLFNAIVPVISFIEKMANPPVGLSLYAVCTV